MPGDILQARTAQLADEAAGVHADVASDVTGTGSE
jgi:hypothetical protein